MRIKKYVSGFCLVLLLGPGVAWSQQVTADFTDELFADAFDNNRMQWEQNSNADKFCILSDGRYCIKRHHPSAPEFFFNEHIPVTDNFDIITQFAFDAHSNKNQSAGVAFMVTGDMLNMLVLEINTAKQYRLWSRRGDEKIYLSGGGETGWEKSTLLRGGKSMNTIEIRGDSGRYDVYFNESHAFSFNDDKFKSGTIALYVAADTYVNFELLNVFRKPVPRQPVLKKTEAARNNQTGKHQSLTDEQKIFLLEKQVEELLRELESCRTQKP